MKKGIRRAEKPQLVISISEQKLYLYKEGEIIQAYRVSTSKYGIGNKINSYKTPLGRHMICAKIGRKARINSIFKNRRNTKKVATINCGQDKDLILTRILRLKGLEPGKNKGRGIDTFERCIYIHGTADEDLIGKPASHGCIRMRNHDIAELFGLVLRGTSVLIRE
jgi:lipoprotein-anchoring transpeptidase ErfK/SrfK